MKHIKNILYPFVTALSLVFLKQNNYLEWLNFIFENNKVSSLILIILLTTIIVIKGVDLIKSNYLIIRKENLSLLLGFILALILLKNEFNWTSYKSFLFALLPGLSIFIIVICLVVRNLRAKHAYDFSEGFEYDSPLNLSRKEDIHLLTEKGDFAENLIHKIENTNLVNGSFTVGIVGNWGSGKTSFINLMIDILRYKKHDIIQFNPWRSEGQEGIIRNFFRILSSFLEKRSSALLKYKIFKYANLVTEKPLSPIHNLFLPSTDINYLFKEIDNTIFELNSKIFVFIDDVDRLDKEELLALFKLIRNSANFRNLVFIVAYDRSYVIDEVKGNNTKEYIKKIINLEVTLPTLIKHDFRDIIIKKMEEIFTEKVVQKEIITLYHTFDSIIFEFLKNIRDLKKFVNGLKLILPLTLHRVAVSKIFLLELLKFYDPVIFQQLYYVGKEEYLNSQDNYTSLRLNRITLDYNKSSKIMSKNDEEKIGPLLKKIFEPLNAERSSQSENCITIPSVFDFYFGIIHPKYSLDYSDFYDHRKSKDFDNAFESIKHWIESGHLHEVLRLYQSIKKFDNINDLIFILKLFIATGIYLTKETNSAFNLKKQNEIIDLNRIIFHTLYSEQMQTRHFNSADQISDKLFEILHEFDRAYIFGSQLLNRLDAFSNKFINDIQSSKFSELLPSKKVLNCNKYFIERAMADNANLDTLYIIYMNCHYLDEKGETRNIDNDLSTLFLKIFNENINLLFFKLLILKELIDSDSYCLNTELVKLFQPNLDFFRFSRTMIDKIKILDDKNIYNELIAFFNHIQTVPQNSTFRFKGFKIFKPELARDIFF